MQQNPETPVIPFSHDAGPHRSRVTPRRSCAAGYAVKRASGRPTVEWIFVVPRCLQRYALEGEGESQTLLLEMQEMGNKDTS